MFRTEVMLLVFFVHFLRLHCIYLLPSSITPLLLSTTSSSPRGISQSELVPVSRVTTFLAPTAATASPTFKESSPELLSCFGKLRLACGVNQNFNRALDKFVGSGRLDKIAEVLLEEARILCTRKELSAVSSFMHNFDSAVLVAQQVTADMSSADKDQLNFMENLNDTNAERIFYLNKFGNIEESERMLLQDSFNEVMKVFMNGTPAMEMSRALAVLTPNDLANIRNLNESERVTHLTYRLQKCNITNDVNVAEDIARLFQIPNV
ncbi:hypothetical protein RB195_008190 [Necator americanus]|uniref:Uncharacterized protein n=1 Tax=Necator americanus TaxID=51031 RepID=A0ABR1CQR7_NECAM